MNSLLHLLNNRITRWTLLPLISLMYWRKGKGLAKVRFHSRFRAWEYRLRGVVYLSPGPGWAYEYNYLTKLLKDTYYKYFTPVPGNCIIDIGAGLGEETLIFAQDVGPTGKIFAIEANPVTAMALEYACRENHFNQVTVLNLAVAAEAGTVEIEDNPQMYVGNTLGRTERTQHTLTVKAMSLDELVAKYDIRQIDLLKSNIEGAEQFLIQGMEKSLGILRQAVISCHDFRHVHNHESEFYVTREKVIRFFEEHGFEVRLNPTGHVVNDDMVYAFNKKMIRG